MVSLTFILTLYIPSLAGVYAQTYLAGTDVAISGNISSSTEHALGLGTKPLVPIDPKTSEDPWTTSLVNGCPKLCSDVGFRVDNWTQIHDSKKLASCNETILFTFNMENAPDRFTSFSTCTVKESSTVDKRHDTIDTVATRNHARRHLMGKRSHANRHVLKRQDDNNITTISDVKVLQKNIASSDSCGAHKSSVKATASFGPAGVIKSTGDISTAFEALLSFFKHGARCGSNVMFAKHGNATLGAYAGADLPYTSAFDVLHNHRLTRIITGAIVTSGTEVFQVCDSTSKDATTLGMFAIDDFESSLATAQENVRTWARGGCVDISATRGSEDNIQWTVLTAELSSPQTNQTKRGVEADSSKIDKRADCRAIQVVSGDGCASLSTRCGIRGADFTKYNPKQNLCSTLAEKQWVCCSAGTLPDMRPKPQADGTCAAYTVVENDGCFAIADSFGLKTEDIETFNEKTWGWAGCSRLQPKQVICLSKGNTPMPAQIEGVACGPQKPGTQPPSGTYDGFDLAELNQCPLKACCSGWGFCGTTAEFCTESKSETGAPGTFKKGENGCISNCGMDVVNNGTAPSTFAKVGYFQAYNEARECLNMDVSEIKDATSDLTHVHFAFLGINADFTVNVPENVKAQWEKFAAGKFPFKKIISFGGWAESTEPATFQRYKDAVKPANRQTVAKNVIQFMDKYDIQGVDFDWEYPAAPDIPGVPSGGAEETANYLKFLTLMKVMLSGSDRSLSIATPASFWYLKAFPVEAISKVVDYFIFMTYDLHGQWDYGSKFANPGCDTGNCLRSHINQTETYNALAMVTKAGVPAYKIFVGVASYGRSFRMADKSCVTENCKFTGSATASDAEPGTCTGTGGYISNAELDSIFQAAESGYSGVEAHRWFHAETDTDYMTYGTLGNGMTDWVAYMSETTKARRIGWIKSMNFGGTSDWAVDLSGWFSGSEGDDDPDADLVLPDLSCDISQWKDTLDALYEVIDSIPAQCRARALGNVLVNALMASIEEYETVKQDYDDKFGYYADWVKDGIDKRLEEYLEIGKGTGLKHMDCEWKFKSDSGKGSCTEAGVKWKDEDLGEKKIWYTMRNESGFYDDLLSTTGVQKEWIYWDDEYSTETPCLCVPGSQVCDCDRNAMRRYNFPRRLKDKKKIEVANPKAIVDAAIPEMDKLSNIALVAYWDMQTGSGNSNNQDVLLSLSTPVFMLQEASKSIKEIKDIGEEQKETKTRDLVFLILSIVFTVIPFAGEAAKLLGGAAALARVALLVGEAGNAGLLLAEVAEDPDSAPWLMLGALLGAVPGAGSGSRQSFKNAADIRRKLDDPSGPGLTKFSKEFQRKDGMVQNIVKKCLY